MRDERLIRIHASSSQPFRPWTVLERVIGTVDVETHRWDTAYSPAE